ncbi:hypothetical protein NW065_03535 [Mycoplasmopsis cynos]|nr:hypothetical protein [Mycoplasmopsis cynos]UWV81068.1 hypothetical protein NW065_03535 [Mycoplasmopsis cynos]
MEKMKPLVYKEKAEFKEVMKNETTFLLSSTLKEDLGIHLV